MKNLNVLKWFVLGFTLVGVTAIFWLLTEDFNRDAQFYIALSSLLFSIVVSTYTTDVDMLFKASRMNDFPQRVAFMTLSFIYEAFVLISIIVFYMIKRIDLNIFASLMIGWLIIFVILTYALLSLNRFVSSNMAASRSFSMKRGELNTLILDLKFAMNQNSHLNENAQLRKKFEDLEEKIKYSDPVSREEVTNLDNNIVEGIQGLKTLIGNAQDETMKQQIVDKINSIEGLIEQRNQILITVK